MKPLIFGRDYFIQAHWGARLQMPAAIARDFLRTVDLLHGIDPLFSSWTVSLDNEPVDPETVEDHIEEYVAAHSSKLEFVRGRFEDIVAAHASRDDYGDPEPVWGYGPFAYTGDGTPDPLNYSLSVKAGANLPAGITSPNRVMLHTDYSELPDPRVITYRIFKAALLAIVEVWDPIDCRAMPHELLKLIYSDGYFRAVWMQYLSLPLARSITPPATSINEYLPNGGLLMSATTETFKVDNPSHVAVARDIAAATAPLNELYVRE
jgi:hypothetical protein